MSKTVAIVLSAGKGRRMNSDTPKQYMNVAHKPVLYYSVSAFQSSYVDEIVIVCGEGDEKYIKEEIVDKYSLSKVTKIVTGGAERYHSVYKGLEAANGDYVLIHDGARPLITKEVIDRIRQTLESEGGCVAAVPVTDTIKIVDPEGKVISTPDRKTLWAMQTPQAFPYEEIKTAYRMLINKEEETLKKGINITDDAMVAEYFGGHDVKVVMGDYNNIKITTLKDLDFAESILSKI
ncbi:MAG: 2-C-methyl-D-erythritol 4-phosphate cytidylyltransferase [Lachnospiraceae bacterium]|nr:2-C-methyl-D-erythritol 4-phosphate cytidylyltransferase [Lachnospiraceae bacterium]MBR4994250.1 2-C-methyl-D-erythritol 4-phosphate cytidylyltransferase [Lachnospiraceae bacterium]MBR5943855.1 2-C-methyl-D-erythritol 4-phosphate cytidylyltransferase [Lachnospiraceae bacterium]